MTATGGRVRAYSAAVAAPAIPRRSRAPMPGTRGYRRKSRVEVVQDWTRTAGWYIAKWFRQMLHVITHPEDAFWDLKRTGDWWSVPFLLACTITARALIMAFMGFHYIFQGSSDQIPAKWHFDAWMETISRMFTLSMTNFFYGGNPEDTSMVQEAFRILIPFVTWCLAHYAIAMIFYGEGNLKHICVAGAFSFAPYILFSWPAAIFLTNVTTLSEKGMYWSVSYIVRLWMIYLFITHIRVIHDFTMKRTLATYGLGLITVLIIWGLLALVYALSINTYEFFYGIFYEFTTR
jgi:hypothetical protein